MFMMWTVRTPAPSVIFAALNSPLSITVVSKSAARESNQT